MFEEKKKNGLHHNFFLVESEKFSYEKNKNEIIDLDEVFSGVCVNIHDDYLHYLSDTLLWIPIYKRATFGESHGLNLYSDTIITKDGALIAKEIFKNWASLFSCGTEKIVLTGNYCFDQEDSKQGHSQKITVNRDKFVGQLKTLVFYCNEVILSENRKYIWHFGI